MRHGKLFTVAVAAAFTAAGAALLILQACCGSRYLAPALWGGCLCLSTGLGLWVTLLVRCIRKKGRAAVIVPLVTVAAAVISFVIALQNWFGGEWGGLVGAFVLFFVTLPLAISALLQFIVLRLIERKMPPAD